MTTPADHTDEAVRDTLRAIGDAAGPAPAFERLTLPDAPVLTVTPDERLPRRALIGAIAAASLAIGGVAAWQVLEDDPVSITDEPITQPSANEPAPSTPESTTPAPTAPAPTTPVSVPPAVAAPAPGWTQLSTPPLAPRSDPIAVWTGTEVIVSGGTGENLVCHDTADCSLPSDPDLFADGAAYNPVSGEWRPIADAPIPLWNAEAVLVDSDVYVIVPCSIYKAFWTACPKSCPPGACRSHVVLRYAPADDEWSMMPPSPGDPGRLVAAGNGLVVVQGSDENGEGADYEFDVRTKGWRKLPDDPLPPSYDRQVVAQGNTLYLFAKPILDSGDSSLSQIRGARYDLSTGGWQELAPSGISGFTTWLVDGQIVINPHFSAAAGGGVYDPRNDTWRPLPPGPTSETWTGDMFGVVGADAAAYNRDGANPWVLDLQTNQWLPVDDRQGERPPDPSGATSIGRSLFVFGGDSWDGDDGGLLNEAWLWTPPGIFDGLDIRLVLDRNTVPSGRSIRSTLVIENHSGVTVTDPGCLLSLAYRWGLLPADQPDADLPWRGVVKCGAEIDIPDGFEDRRPGHDFPARTQTGDHLPPGEYLAVIEFEGRTERLTVPVTVE